jgi:ATP-dependent DNA helicase PIF1
MNMMLSNHNKKWNNIDIKNIIIDLNNNISFEELELKYQRKSNAIKSKLLERSYELIDIYNFDIEVISTKIKLPISDISNYIDFKLNHNKTIPNDESLIKQYNDLKQEIKEKPEIKEKQEINNPNEETVILNKEQLSGLNNFKDKKNIFITGPGGTGKSVLIKEIIKYCNENNIKFGVTATTGSAALLIGGRTIHSYLGIGIGNRTASELFKDNRYRLPHIIKKIRELKVLIIDEISLMDKNLLKIISHYLSLVRNDTDPFGGLQVAISGDFCQLEPINGEYCFLSEIWDKLEMITIFLNKMVRQEHDKEFQKILRSLRYGICNENILKVLKQCNRPLPLVDIKPTILYSKNIDVEKINKREYDKLILTNKSYTYEIKLPDIKKNHDKIKNWIKTLDIPSTVDICINAQIIVTANISQDTGIVNGTRGIVSALNHNSITIKTVNNKLVDITYFKTTYSEDNTMYFHSMPIKLAYALSIHKSQGATLDAIEINIGKDIFAAGQAYTALSRTRSLDNVIIKDVSIDSFIVKEEVLQFYSKIDKKLKL